MFSIASKFDVPELKKFYEKVLEEKLETCNMLETFEIFLLAHQDSCNELKLQSFNIMEKLLGEKITNSLMNDTNRLKALIEKKREFDKLLF